MQYVATYIRQEHVVKRVCIRGLCGCILAFFLVSCGTAPQSTVRGLKPYTVRGEKYYPLQSAVGYNEEGIASWYGPGFHGKKTANGETFNQNAMTAAHTVLPLGTMVRVTNLENGKDITVRINDRGPFVHDRLIDLSRRAAEKLDMRTQGTAQVRVEHIPSEGDVPPVALAAAATPSATDHNDDYAYDEPTEIFHADEPLSDTTSADIDTNVDAGADVDSDAVAHALATLATAQDTLEQSVLPEERAAHDLATVQGDYYVQLGSFNMKKFASFKAKEIMLLGIEANSYKNADSDTWSVRVGPFRDYTIATSMLARLELDYSDARLVVDPD